MLDGYAAGDDPAYVSQMPSRVRTFARTLTAHRAPARRARAGCSTSAPPPARSSRPPATTAGTSTGIEPNAWLADWGRARSTASRSTSGRSTTCALTAEGFDVVTLWDVIEHTPDPMHVLRRARALLKPGGLLVVNYPDIGSWIARAMGRSWPFLSSVHLYYFTRATIRAALRSGRLRDHRHPAAPAAAETRLHRVAGQRREPGVVARWARASSPRSALGAREVPYWLGQTFVRRPRADSGASTAT